MDDTSRNSLNILNEMAKAAKMGMNSINYVSSKVGDTNMRENLSTQYRGYGKLLDKVNTEFEKYGEIPDDETVATKMMTWSGIQMNTINDKSNNNIAKIMLQGNSMGVEKCQELLNQNPNTEQVVKDILNQFITFQTDNIEQMKKFL